jgi:hypothetical protein
MVGDSIGGDDASSGIIFMSYGESIENRKRKIHAGEERLHRK